MPAPRVLRSFPSHVETPRLLGDRPVREDARALTAIVGDERIPEAVYPARFRTPGRTLAFLDRSIRDWEERGFGVWTARERETGSVVGRVGIVPTVVEGREAVEVGWFLARSRWGRGYATELAEVALREGFAGLGLDEVVSFTLHANAASQAVMRKLGLTPRGEIEHAGLPHRLFAITAAEHAARGG